jgi:hypothetical protein
MLATMRARQAVKDQLRREGLKVSHYAAREITLLANDWLAQHREEVMPECLATITKWTLRGDFGKRTQRALRAKLSSDAQTQKA